MTYKLIGMPATRAFRVIWALEELGADYTLDPARPGSAEARAVNPSGKIPVLIDGADTITDSTAILSYLADKHGQLTHPAGTPARARQDAVMHAFLDEIESLLWTASRHGFLLPEERRVPALRETLIWEFERNLAALADRLTGPYLAGDRFTIADIVAVHNLNWAHGAKFPVSHPVWKDYGKRVRAREGFRQARAHMA